MKKDDVWDLVIIKDEVAGSTVLVRDIIVADSEHQALIKAAGKIPAESGSVDSLRVVVRPF